jgi:hypothetical protein
MGLVTDFAISERKDGPMSLFEGRPLTEKVLQPLLVPRWLAKSAKN